MTFSIHTHFKLKHIEFFWKSFGSWGIIGEIAYVEHLTPQRWQLNEVLLCSITNIRTLQLRCRAEISGSCWLWQHIKAAADLKSDRLYWSKCGPSCQSDTGWSRNQIHIALSPLPSLSSLSWVCTTHRDSVQRHSCLSQWVCEVSSLCQ